MAAAAQRWADELAAWEIPDELLERVEDSPYGWSQTLWKRRSRLAATQPPTETDRIVVELLSSDGALLDVGVGRGRASLAIAARGHRLIGVDESLEMLTGFAAEAGSLGVEVETHQGRWPDIAAEVPAVDVALSANVAYNVPDIEPFLSAMVDHARTAVVLEVTEAHPWAHLAPLYLAIHDLERPQGPTADLLAEVVHETFGIEPEVHHWERAGQVWFEDWGELLDHYGRRLVVPQGERESLRPVLEPLVREDDGRLHVGEGPTRFVTLVLRTDRR